MEDPLPGSCLDLPVVFAAIGILPLILGAMAALVSGILLGLGQSALENLSWKRLQERLQSDQKEAAVRKWLDNQGQDHLILTFEWTRLLLYLVFVLCADRLLLSSLAGSWALGFLALLGFILLCGEALPRFVARYNAEAVFLGLRPFLAAVMILLLPVVRLMQWLPDAVGRLSGYSPEEFHHEKLTAEITDAAEEGERSGVLEESEREMIENIIDLGDTRVEEVMTPRIDLISVSSSASHEEARVLAVQSGHSRIPVHEGNRDQIIGVLHVKDLLKTAENGAEHTVRILMRKPLFVPENKDIGELLREFKELKTHIAIVLDQYGGTSGLITMEDILEEIVGEIDDEFDATQSPPAIQRVSPETIQVNAKIHVHDLNTALGLNLPDDAGFETLGGFVFSTLGRVPRAGESFQSNGAEFTILQADARRVSKVEISMIPHSPQSP